MHVIDINKGHQFDPAFLAVAPNNRIPAIVDRASSDGDAPLAVFESPRRPASPSDQKGARRSNRSLCGAN